MKLTSARTVAFIVAGFAAVAAFAVSAAAPADPVEALLKAAKVEGEVTFYVASSGFGERIVEGFSKKYGVPGKFVRMPSAQLLTRYASEAAAGNIAADLVFNSGGTLPFAQDAVKHGWLEPISEAGLPAITSGQFPKKFNTGLTAIAGVAPWVMLYNTEKVKGADIPKDWPDMLNPKFKGQVLLSDPRASDAYIEFWAAIIDRYGADFFAKLRAQGPRQYSAAIPGTQALAAGEGSVFGVITPPAALTIKDKGAPIEIVTPDFTTGVEHHLMLTARSKAKHPNAARLLAQWMLSPEGNKWINDTSISVYAMTGLPKEYRSPQPGAAARKDEVIKALGL